MLLCFWGDFFGGGAWLVVLFLNQVREVATVTMKQCESYLTFVQNMHLNFVGQCSKTKTFGRCLEKALSRELQRRLTNTPQLFKASLILCIDICIHFMENLRILQPLKSFENKLQQNIYTFRTLELISHLKQYILEIVLIMARKPANKLKNGGKKSP